MQLIIGADGLIGGALSQGFSRQGHPHLMTSLRPVGGQIKLDLGGSFETWELPHAQIDTAFLCAAQTSLKSCEEDPERSALINVTNTVKLAARLLDAGAFVIFLSSNLVFDGLKPFYAEDDVPNPKLEYGRQKARAERALLELSGNVAVVRLSKVVHPGMALFRSWADSLRNGGVIHPYSDLMMSPISLDFTVEAIEKIALKRAGGITHLSSDRELSYEDCARMLAKEMDACETLIQPVQAPAGRAGFSTLNMGRAVRELGIAVPSAIETLNTLFKNML